jgi:hypothetical protein
MTFLFSAQCGTFGKRIEERETARVPNSQFRRAAASFLWPANINQVHTLILPLPMQPETQTFLAVLGFVGRPNASTPLKYCRAQFYAQTQPYQFIHGCGNMREAFDNLALKIS